MQNLLMEQREQKRYLEVRTHKAFDSFEQKRILLVAEKHIEQAWCKGSKYKAALPEGASHF